MHESPVNLRDLLYLDFDKAASIWSQFEEGLPERVSVTSDAGKDRTAGTKFGIPGIAEANLGVDYQQKRSVLYSRTLHHDVLNRVERALADSGLVADLTSEPARTESSPQKIRSVIGKRPYLRAEGASVIEDYQRMLAISEKFNDFIEFLGKLQQKNVKSSEEYIKLKHLIESTKSAAEQIADRNQKIQQKSKVKELELQLEKLINAQQTKLDDWFVDGIRLWIETFLKFRINFRIYPFPQCPSFQVLCNLKRECFVDANVEHLLYGYGNRPNVPLAVFGLLTSIPDECDSPFDPLKEFDTISVPSERLAFEKGFRGVFSALDGLEAFMRYSRFPNVTVHPIAVYRSFPVAEGYSTH
jgi:hypothetical protein